MGVRMDAIVKKKGTFLYQQVKDHILGQMEAGVLHVGDRVPSEQELSRQLQVSRLTVRKAYAGMIETGRLSAVQGRGTFVVDVREQRIRPSVPERQSGVETRRIGVIFPEVTFFFGPILKGIEAYASRNHFDLSILFNDTFARECKAVDTVLENDFDGVIISPQRTPAQHDAGNYLRLKASGLPLVMIGKPSMELDLDCVMFSSDTGAYDAVARLIAMGHVRILHLYHSGHDMEALVERRSGYEKAMDALLPDARTFALDCRSPNWKTLLERMTKGGDAFTAVFSDSDSLAVQAYLHLQRKGIHRLSLEDFIAFNDSDACKQFQLHMPLIEISRVEMGLCAVDLLKKRFTAGKRSYACAYHAVFRPCIRESECPAQADALTGET